ncbi:MAG: efflux RND transporter permease subunit, partial [Candidatus Binataceae bacterium]
AQYNIRNWLATVRGASVPPPFGGKYRQIQVYVNRDALQARGLTLMNVVHALNNSNLIIPAGDAKIGATDYYIYSNSMVPSAAALNNVPVKIGGGEAPVLVSDIGHAEDSHQIQLCIVRVNGQRSVYIPVLKQSGANTLSVVDGVEKLLPHIVGLPKGMELHAIFSQATYVREAIDSLEHEAASGTVLACLMILLFLGSFRSTIAIFLSIPLSILAASVGLYFGGQTINIMTLGGFALAIGRLVDNSIVVLENINRHLAMGKAPMQASREGADEVNLPVLASTITTIVVFLPVMFLYGVSKYLFSALAVAVTLSMIASYVVAMTVVPIYCARFLTVEGAVAAEEGHGRGPLAAFMRGYERFAKRFDGWLRLALDYKLVVIIGLTALFVVSLFAFPLIGTRLFPRTDSGQFIITFHAPLGMRIEDTNALTAKLEATIRKVIPKSELKMIVSNIGLAPGFEAIYSPNAAADSGFTMVELHKDHKVSTFTYMRRLKKAVARSVPQLTTFFSSGSIIDSVLNYGLPAPIDVQLSGLSYKELFPLAREIREVISGLPEVARTFIPQQSGYPTLDIKVNRVKAARLGLTQKDVIDNVITALTSNAMIKPSIWIDPKTGNDYFLAAQYAEKNINSLETLENIPVRSVNHGSREDSVLLRDVATIVPERNPAEADHYNIQRVVDVLVTPSTQNQGGTQKAVLAAMQKLKLPKDVSFKIRGSVSTMEKSFSSFAVGLLMAVALLYLVMVAQFRSFLDPFIIMFAVPMGLIGVVWTLLLTHTTLNIESFMGIIAMVGIVVSNSILLVDFANIRRRSGQELRGAVVDATRIRMRPILMTALATIAGLMPLAFKLGAGSEASAPLARATIGGLLVSTVLTLVLVPAVYELIYAHRKESL